MVQQRGRDDAVVVMAVAVAAAMTAREPRPPLVAPLLLRLDLDPLLDAGQVKRRERAHWLMVHRDDPVHEQPPETPNPAADIRWLRLRLVG
jgi:hypothetical protein